MSVTYLRPVEDRERWYDRSFHATVGGAWSRAEQGRAIRHMEREASGASAEAVRAQLRRILGSPHFDASQRSRKFLAAVIEEAPAGRSDRIEAQNRPVAPALIRRLRASLAKAGLPGLSPISGD